MKWFETTTNVRWSEVDGSGVVYYPNFFVYFDSLKGTRYRNYSE